MYAELIENLGDAVFVADARTGIILGTNRRGEEILGRPRNEIVSRHHTILHPPGAADHYRACFAAHRDTPESGQTPLRMELCRADGECVPVEILVSRASLSGRAVLIGVFRDLREREHLERALRESEQRFRLAAQSISDVVWDCDCTTESIRWYGDFSRIAPDDDRPAPQTQAEFKQRVHRDDRERMDADCARARTQGGPFGGEYRVVLSSGAVRHWSVRGVMLLSEQGEPVRAIGAVADITERKHAEQALQSSETRLRKYIEQAPCMVAVANSQGVIEEINPAVERFLGLRAEQVIGSDYRDLLAGEDPGDDGQMLHELMTTGRAQREIRVRDSSGNPRWMSCQTAALDAGRFLSISLDVTDLKNTEAALRRTMTELETINHQLAAAIRNAGVMAELAEAANAAKSQFLANMSHEIRTPMTAILGYADLALDVCPTNCSTSDCVRGHVETIRRNANHLLELINDILDLSKIESGQFEVVRGPTSLPQIVNDVATMIRGRAQSKSLAFEVEFDGLVPAVINTDERRLRQILINLLGNAIKFTEKGEVRLKIARDGATAIRFDVVDTGIGIPSDQFARIFEPFSQADGSTARRFGGTGLGLSISRELAQHLGGNIGIESKVGEGSRFILTIDAGALANVRMVAPTLAPTAASSAAQLPPHILDDARILLAEDSADNQRLISAVLTRAGAHVHLASNGREAVDSWAAAEYAGRPFHAILMDMQMPIMDGYEAARELRRLGCAAPVIALTANAMSGDRQQCLDAGCDDYQSKPIDRQALVEALVRHCRRASSSGATHQSGTEPAPE